MLRDWSRRWNASLVGGFLSQSKDGNLLTLADFCIAANVERIAAGSSGEIKMTAKKIPYRIKMWAIMRDGNPYMALPDLDKAEACYGVLSLNGFSGCKWTIQKVDVRFPHETATERRKRLGRHVHAVVELNAAMERR